MQNFAKIVIYTSTNSIFLGILSFLGHFWSFLVRNLDLMAKFRPNWTILGVQAALVWILGLRGALVSNLVQFSNE